MPHIIATEQPLHYTATGILSGEDVLVSDTTLVGNLTGVNPALSLHYDADENAYLGKVATIAGQFPPVPEQGTWLEQGDVYRHGDGCVMVRQSHTRTEHSIDELVPVLFLVYRADADNIEWIAGESVTVGTRRMYDGALYECIQAHVTQEDWTPTVVPALWVLVDDPTGEWQAGTRYAIGDVVLYESTEWECIQAHTAQIGWEPPRVPALWKAV